MKGIERVVDHICGKSAEVIWLCQKKLRIFRISYMDDCLFPLPLRVCVEIFLDHIG